MIPKLQLQHVCKQYDLFAVQDLSFPVASGYITGFIGRNGAGKTTTIKMILSCIRPDAGTISMDGKPLASMQYLQKVGVVMDGTHLAKDWSMRDVEHAMAAGYDHWDGARFWQFLQEFGIASQKRVKELSRGMKTKLMFAIALSHGADLLILDEPTSGLDPSMRDELMGLLRDFVQDEHHTVLFSTHITQDLEQIADYIVFIDNGKLICSMPKDDFLDAYRILKFPPQAHDALHGKPILGMRKSEVHLECLIAAKDDGVFPPDAVRIQPTIDQIMILYGRGM